MAFILRVFQDDRTWDHEIAAASPLTLGSGRQDTIQLPALGPQRLSVTLDAQGWAWKLSKPLWKLPRPIWRLQTTRSGRCAYGEMMVLGEADRVAIALYESNPDHARIIDLSAREQLTLGRESTCEISIASKLISARHVELVRGGHGWSARDLGSANGTYLNGVKVKEAPLRSGDILDIGLCRLYMTGDSMSLCYSGAVQVNLAAEAGDKTADSPDAPYPHMFQRSPRLQDAIPAVELDFQTAPSIGGKPNISWSGVLGTPIASVSIMLVVSLILGGPLASLLLSVPMTVFGVITSVRNYKKQCRQYHQTEALRLEKYEAYLGEQEAEALRLQTLQHSILTRIHPPTPACLEIAAGPSRRLWERRWADPDFMELRVGSGTLPSCVTFRLPPQTLSLEEDALANRPRQLADRLQTVANVPITWHGGQNPTCGVIGRRESCIRLAKNMLLQAATHHCYDELRIVAIIPEDEQDQWAFVKWLPHTYDDTRSMRYIVSNRASARRVLGKLEEELGQRGRNTEPGDSGSQSPYYLFVCADSTLLERHPILKHLLSNDPQLGVGALFLYNEISRLPKECAVFLEVQGEGGLLYHRSNSAHRQGFDIDSMQERQFDAFARTLAPIRVEISSGQGALPTALSFLQGYRVATPARLPQVSSWADRHPEQSMAVPVGVRRSGEPFLFDIHEKQHGPHGLVAGMTGSGKSEMVQSWILSMALAFPPQAVSFVLIDFKGTGLILPFRNLPHLAGTISDLDINITRNLIALENELTRRKALMDEHHVSNISGYLKLHRQGKAQTPLSYLFIIIDEFAEFKVQFPEFMGVINRIFAIGRTLGVHILLLTQKPTSVVDDKMSANTRFRWCLKVASSADSKEMLRHPDAARITNPGRAFVQVGEDEVFEEIQSYWSGAPYSPHQDTAPTRPAQVSVVDFYGLRHSFEPDKATGLRAEQSEIDAIVGFLDSHVRSNGIPRARNIWTDKLAEHICLEDIQPPAFDGQGWNSQEDSLAPVVGMIDDPRSQSQYPFRLNLHEEGHVVVYGAPGAGKTTFLQTLIMSLALSCPPDTLSLYLMDFGGGSLNLFRDLPHVGGVARDSEEEKILKLCQLLDRELDRRKALMADAGVVSIESYREVSGDALPYIVLILDNFTPVLSLYPGLDGFFQALTREGASFGLYLVATATTTNAVSFRIAQNIRAGIALRMSDRTDYISIVGRTDGLEPDNAPGRGLLRSKPPLEFQTALPAGGETENQRVAQLRQRIQRMDETWAGRRAAPIPMMPQAVREPDFKTPNLLLGLSVSTIEPVELELSNTQFLLVSAAPSCNLHPLFTALATQLVAKLPRGETLVYDPAGSGLRGLAGEGGQYITQAEAFDTAIAALMPALQQRRDLAQAGDAGGLDALPPIVLIIGDLGPCFEAVSNDTVKRLANIVNLGAGLGVYLLLGGHCGDVAHLHKGGDIFTISMVGKGAALLAGGSFNTHSVFRSGLSYTEASAELPAGEGYVLSQSALHRIKYVQP